MAAAFDGPNEEDWDPSVMAPGQDATDFFPKDQQEGVLVNSNVNQDLSYENRPGASYPLRIAPLPRSLYLDRDVEDDMAVRGVCGLANLGNTCFMNAGIQCLSSIPSLASFFLENQIVSQVSEERWDKHLRILQSFAMLVNKLWAGMFSSIHPGAFHQTFGSLHKQFANCRQHDCQEFIAFLLDSLHEILASELFSLNQKCKATKSLPGNEQPSDCTEDAMETSKVVEEQTQLGDGNKAAETINCSEQSGESCEGKEGCDEKNIKTSVIDDTLQGTFKSIVECLTCGHVSVTFEPFMYLSLPIPRAMERQIVVTFVSAKPESLPMRYSVTVQKFQYVGDLKTALIAMWPEGSKPDVDDVVLTEVYCWSIARILDDAFPLVFITSTLRQLVAFELIKPNTQQVQTVDMADGSVPALGNVLSTSSLELDEIETCSETVENSSTDALQPPGSGNTSDSTGNQSGFVSHSSLQETDEHHDVTSHFEESADSYVPVNSPVVPELSNHPRPPSPSLSSIVTPGDVSGLSTSLAASLWHTCAICLEEMIERELMTHPACGCMLCQPCLEMAKSHHGGNSFVCPVCLKDVAADGGFVCLSAGNQEKEISSWRDLCIPVEFKQVSPGIVGSRLEQVRCVALLQLTNVMTPHELHQRVCDMLHRKIGDLNSVKFTIHVAYGLFPSYESLIEQHPDVLSSGIDVVEMRPSDTICVVFTSALTSEMRARLCAVIDHQSTQNEVCHTRTLVECFQAFIESEELGDENTWYCPRCCSNQKARKTLSLWKVPKTLIVHLKRFVFEGMCGEKIDAAVGYPLEGLDMAQYIVEGSQHGDLVYDLISCVCHSGGLNSGHYTSHVKNPITGVWYYQNDRLATPEQETEAMPDAYILFYQCRDCVSVIPDKPRDEILAELHAAEEEDLLSQQLAIQFEHRVQDWSPAGTDLPGNPFEDSPAEGRTPPPQLSPLLPSTPVAAGGAAIPMEEAAVELQPLSRATYLHLQPGHMLHGDEMEPLLGDSMWSPSESVYPSYMMGDYTDAEATSYFSPNVEDAVIAASLLGQHDVTTQWAIEQSYQTLESSRGNHGEQCLPEDNVTSGLGEDWSLLKEGNAWTGKQGGGLVEEGSDTTVSELMSSRPSDAQEQMWQLSDFQEQ